MGLIETVAIWKGARSFGIAIWRRVEENIILRERLRRSPIDTEIKLLVGQQAELYRKQDAAFRAIEDENNKLRCALEQIALYHVDADTMRKAASVALYGYDSMISFARPGPQK